MAVIKDLKKKRKLINLKVSPEELKLIQGKAKKYANGNTSAWIRYAATQLSPKRKDVTK
jgi:hypothetical protein